MRKEPMGAAVAAPSSRRLLVALVAVQVFFGGMAVAGKLVLPYVPPLALAECRLASAAVVLFAIERALVRAPIPPARDLARFALFALLGVVLNQGLFLTGLSFTTATNAVLLVATIPAFTILVATVMRHERASALKLVGLAVSFAGVAVLVFARGAEFGFRTMLGDALVILNALSYSIYLVISRPALQRYDPLTLISWVFVFGALEMGVVALPQLATVEWSTLTPSAWAGFAYIIVCATILSYAINNWVLRHTSASHVASFVYLQPVVGAIAAALLLDEALPPVVFVAGALILLGVYLAGKARPSQRAGNPTQ